MKDIDICVRIYDEQDYTTRGLLIDVVKRRIKHADQHFGLSPHNIDDIGRKKELQVTGGSP